VPISIPGFEFSSNGFLRLADGCPLLEEVTFLFQRLTDDALQSIAANCSGLRSIRLNHCVKISDTGVSALSACRSLELITLDYCSITDASLLALANVRGLRSVNVNNCLAITDIGVRALVRRCALLHIEIQYNTNITNASLFSIAKHCPNIIHLNVGYCTKITDEGIEPLLRSAPTMQLNTLGCDIKHGGNKCHN
jgi:Leucine Rich repeat